MIKALETGTFENPESGKTVDMKEAREVGIAAAGISCVALSQLKDIQGRPVVLNKRYLFREANKERNRMTDFEDDNLRRVVNNTKWHNGIHLTMTKQYSHIEYLARIEYPGKGKYLLGTHYSGNDVTLNNNWSLSN